MNSTLHLATRSGLRAGSAAIPDPFRAVENRAASPIAASPPPLDLPARLPRPTHADDDVQLLFGAFGDALLSPATVHRLVDAALVFEGRPGRLPVASPRDPLPAWWLVRHGTVALGETTPEGEFIERQRLQRGQWLDVAGALSGQGTWLQPARLLSRAELIALPLRDLGRACAADEAFALAFGRVLASQVREVQGRLLQLSQADVGSRVARWLLEQAVQHHALLVGGRWSMVMRKQDLASHLGTTAESLSRALARLSRQGVIRMQGYAITVLQPELLKDLAASPVKRRRHGEAGAF
jgi:CRP/FNR family transcriptional regulator